MKWASQKIDRAWLRDLLATLVQSLSTPLGSRVLLLTCIPAISLLITIVQIFYSRSSFPMNLEWIEGGMLLHSHRVLNGQELFTAGKEGFMPFSYPPLHTYLVALLGGIFGLEYWVGRALSLASMSGVVFLLSREVYRAFKDQAAALIWAVLAMGTMIAAFPLTRGWFDLIRNDELVLLMVIGAGVLVASPAPLSRARFWGLACLMNASVFTKQTAAFYLIWILLFQLARDRSKGLKLVFALALLGALTTLALEMGTERRYLYYTLFVLSKQGTDPYKILRAFRIWTEFAPYLYVMPLLLLGGAWSRRLNRRAVLWSGMLASAIVATLLPFMKVGGYYNNLLPVAVLAGPSFLCLFASFLERSKMPPLTCRGVNIVGLLTVGLYLQSLQFEAARFSVTGAHRQKASRLQIRLKELSPSLLIPQQPFLAVQAGSSLEQMHEMSWIDWWQAGIQDLDLRPFIEEQKPEYVVMTGREMPFTIEALRESYALDISIPRDEYVYPLTGYASFLRWVLRRLPPQPPGSRCVFDFEGDYSDFIQTGTAFRGGPHAQGARTHLLPVGRQGERMATSLGMAKSEAAMGTLTSPEFELSTSRLSFLVGGSDSKATRLELVVDGKVVRQSTGTTGVGYLKYRLWQIPEYQGKKARLRIIDEEPSAYILVDHVCLIGE